MPESFAFVLGHYVQRSHYSIGQVAVLSGLPKRTIANWLGGIVLKPQQWQGIVMVAVALKLSEAEASQLLTAAGHPPLTELRQLATGAERELLLPWPQPKSAPFQAIADLPYFVGREQALRVVGDVLLQGQHVAICNLHGMGGVGKTSLAARLAYQLRPFFPDGILWAKLDTSDTLSILRAFAAAYSEDVSSYHDLDGCASAVRSILADKQALIVLDNAESSEQVRPLLPPTTGKTAVLITTRHDLAVADGMHRFHVETFDPASGESLALFVSFLGKDAVQEWREALQSIADLLGHLPLAVAIAAGRLANGRVHISKFLEQLQQAEQRLDVLVREDRSVHLSFDLTYQVLSPEMQHFFAALGAFGGDDFGIPAVAYITELTEDEVQARLTALYQLSLVQITHPLRYRLHPLLRDYAREHIESENIYFRLAAFYIKLIEELNSTDYQSLLPETSNILAVIQTAYERDMPLLLTKSVIGYHRFLLAQGFLSHLRESLALARQAASKIGNKLTLADILHKQGILEVETGHYDLGASILLEGLELARTLNSSNIESQKIIYEIYKNLGLSYRRQSLNQQASQYYEESLQIAKEMEDEWGIIEATIGLIEIEGNYHKAKIIYTEIVERSSLRDSDHRVWINLLSSLSTICILEEEYDQALVYLQEGERLAILHGYHLHRIRTLWLLAAIRHIKGDETGANEYAQESLKIAREAGYLRSVSFLLGELGKWSLQKRNYSEAISYLNEAIALGRKLGISGRHFRILHYWGELHLAKEQWHEAVNIWHEVLEKAEGIIYIVAANYGLACVAEAQADEVSAKYYTSNWQALLAEMNSCQKRALKHWLPNIPINA